MAAPLLRTQSTERFAWLYDEAAYREPAVWNTIIARSSYGTILPSKGSLVPGWLLTLPPRRVINLHHLDADERIGLLRFTQPRTEALKSISRRIFQFEHGAKSVGSVLGCGVDIGHLHTVPLVFDLIDALLDQTGSEIMWRATSPTEDPWTEIWEDEYILVRDLLTNRNVIGVPRIARSQIVRRVIATSLDCSQSWDYSAHPFAENSEATVGLFVR